MCLHHAGARLRIFADPMQQIFAGTGGKEVAAAERQWTALKSHACRFEQHILSIANVRRGRRSVSQPGIECSTRLRAEDLALPGAAAFRMARQARRPRSGEGGWLSFWTSCDRIEPVERKSRQLQRRSLKVIAEMPKGGRARDEQNVRGTLQEPCQGDLHGRRAELTSHLRKHRGLKRRDAAQGVVRDVGDAFSREVVDQCVISAV
jgi:hypothetical protein